MFLFNFNSKTTFRNYSFIWFVGHIFTFAATFLLSKSAILFLCFNIADLVK